jgi:hypothetical protein
MVSSYKQLIHRRQLELNPPSHLQPYHAIEYKQLIHSSSAKSHQNIHHHHHHHHQQQQQQHRHHHPPPHYHGSKHNNNINHEETRNNCSSTMIPYRDGPISLQSHRNDCSISNTNALIAGFAKLCQLGGGGVDDTDTIIRSYNSITMSLHALQQQATQLNVKKQALAHKYSCLSLLRKKLIQNNEHVISLSASTTTTTTTTTITSFNSENSDSNHKHSSFATSQITDEQSAVTEIQSQTQLQLATQEQVQQQQQQQQQQLEAKYELELKRKLLSSIQTCRSRKEQFHQYKLMKSKVRSVMDRLLVLLGKPNVFTLLQSNNRNNNNDNNNINNNNNRKQTNHNTNNNTHNHMDNRTNGQPNDPSSSDLQTSCTDLPGTSEENHDVGIDLECMIKNDVLRLLKN